MVDVRSPIVQAFGSCANAADPTGVLDSTCAINAAIAYAETALGASGVRMIPKVRIPAGNYLISGQIVTFANIEIAGDATAATKILTNNITANIFTVRQQNIQTNVETGPTMVQIHDLQIGCAVEGTQGSTYSGCNGTAIEIERTQFRVRRYPDFQLGRQGNFCKQRSGRGVFLEYLLDRGTLAHVESGAGQSTTGKFICCWAGRRCRCILLRRCVQPRVYI